MGTQNRHAKDLPADVLRYVDEGLESGMPEEKAWAIAWSRWCAYKNPGSDHCKKSKGEYFPGRKASAQRVATVYRKSSGVRILPKLRREINLSLIHMGLDGNKMFDTINSALNTIGVVLTNHGVEWDEVLNGFTFKLEKGRTTVDIALTNDVDVFSPTSLTNTQIVIHWTTMSTGKFEVLAYLS